MSETMAQIVAGVRAKLRRPSDLKLPYLDIVGQVNDCLRGYVQEMSLGERGGQTLVAEADISADDIDYILSIPGGGDFEPVRLERGVSVSGVGDEWSEVTLVPFEAWERHAMAGYVAGSIYGGADGTTRVKLNLDATDFGLSRWRLSYRQPLLTTLQLGSNPPIPSNFVPMVKLEVALLCMPIVNDETDEWKAWVKETKPVYASSLLEWKSRWQDYLSHSLAPSTVPVRPFNEYRRPGSYRRRRAYLPIQ